MNNSIWAPQDLLDVNIKEALNWSASEEEIESVRGMMETDGWKIVAEKLFPKCQIELLLSCARANVDVQFARGRYDGFAFAKRLVDSLVEPKKEKADGRPASNIFTQKSARAAGGGY